MKSMFLWKLILTFTDIDYSLVKKQEKEECFALWAVKQKQLIKLKLKKGGVKKKNRFVWEEGKKFFTYTVLVQESIRLQKKKKNEKNSNPPSCWVELCFFHKIYVYK